MVGFPAAAIGLMIAASAQQAPAVDLRPFHTGFRTAVVELVASKLNQPAAIAFLPDGRALVAERMAEQTGRLSVLDVRTGALTPVSGLSESVARQPGAGIHDVLVHPEHAANGIIFVSYTIDTPAGSALAVSRARLQGHTLTDVRRIFTAAPFLEQYEHYGGRMAFDSGHLFITNGDRQHRDLAQSLDNHVGKIVRITEDGRVPRDNPFVDSANARPEIWSRGHRNPQGLLVHPATRELWSHEHGPRGGDEINRIVRGANYGWPVVSAGFEYDGGPIGMGMPTRAGIQRAAHTYVPSIAPSGFLLYSGRAFPEWKDSFFLGALVLLHLNRVVLENGAARLEERLLLGRNWRVRAIAEAPDGAIYIGVDNGYILRIRPGA